MSQATNQTLETNCRPASSLNAGRQFGRASCAPPSRSAAVAHLSRCAMKCASFIITIIVASVAGGALAAESDLDDVLLVGYTEAARTSPACSYPEPPFSRRVCWRICLGQRAVESALK